MGVRRNLEHGSTNRKCCHWIFDGEVSRARRIKVRWIMRGRINDQPFYNYKESFNSITFRVNFLTISDSNSFIKLVVAYRLSLQFQIKKHLDFNQGLQDVACEFT